MEKASWSARGPHSVKIGQEWLFVDIIDHVECVRVNYFGAVWKPDKPELYSKYKENKKIWVPLADIMEGLEEKIAP